ncbi:hypothetical protein, partial [uncultured Kingella sp.]|uniref:hypothetical protein n=1 Tax=uncultured Kingella sp. TaxID=159270 RepID=UPI00259A1088
LLGFWVQIAKISAYLGYFFPSIFTPPQNPPQSLAGWLLSLLWLFLYAAAPVYFFTAFKHARKIAKHPAAQAFPIRYILQTKESTATWLLGYNAKGLSANFLSLNWQNFTPADWAEILPAASADEVHRLSQMIIQRLNSK